MITLQGALDAVKSFNEKHEFAVGVPITVGSPRADNALQNTGEILQTIAKLLEMVNKRTGSLEALRMHLSVEELAERAECLRHGDRVGLLDALCDELYVLLGTAVAYDMPIAEGFMEVHKSNMTKGAAKSTDPRLRDKGPGYVAPDLERVLREHDARRAIKLSADVGGE